MRTFQAVVGTIALILITAQTLRHVYVRWIEPRGTVLEPFQEKIEQSIASAKTLHE